MRNLFVTLSLAVFLAASCGQQTQTHTLEGLTPAEASQVIEIALSSEKLASYRAEFKETWIGDVYSVQRLVWLDLGTDIGKEKWPAVQIYFGEYIERNGGVEVLLLVDLDNGEVIHSFDKPLKPLPSPKT